MEVTDSTKTIVGVTFGYLYDQMYDDARRNSLVEAVGKFTQDMLMDPGQESKVRSQGCGFGPFSLDLENFHRVRILPWLPI